MAVKLIGSVKKGKPRGRPFKKGNRSFKNRKPRDETQRKLANLSKKLVKDAVLKCFTSTRSEVEIAFKNPETPMAEMMVYGVAVNAAKTGDYDKLEWLAKQGGIGIEQYAYQVENHLLRLHKNVSRDILNELTDLELETMKKTTQKVIELSNDDGE